MKFLVVGLGSMGKRRIRNLQYLNKKKILGFDLKNKRCKEANKLYGIKTYNNFDKAIKIEKPDALIISTPPDKHYYYAKKGLKKKINSFLEVSIEKSEKVFKLAKYLDKLKVSIIPSCTMMYFAMPIKIKKLILKKKIGKVLNINYHTGQYLPDWHPWERITDFYVSKKNTGACREIVPFELTWLCDIFGLPKVKNSFKAKLSKLNTNIDDIYHFVLQFPKNVIANITIEVLSRPLPSRELVIIGSDGKITYNESSKIIKYCNYKNSNIIKKYKVTQGKSYKGYINPERPYIDEMKDFLSAIKKNKTKKFPNNLFKDSKILSVLEDIERKSKI